MQQVGDNPHDSRLTLEVLFEVGYDDTPENTEPITDVEYLNTQAFELMRDCIPLHNGPYPPFVLYSGCDTERDEITFRGDTEFLRTMANEARDMRHINPYGGRFMMVEKDPNNR